MKAIFLILATLMLFMFVFVANADSLGTAKPLLSVAAIGLFFYCIFEFSIIYKQERKKPSGDEALREYKELIAPPKKKRTYL